MKNSRMKRAWCGALLVASGLSLASVPTAQAADQDAPVGVTIVSATQNGTGCSKKDAATAISDDRRAVTITYSKFQAEIGPTAKKNLATSTCNVSIKFNVPAGWSFSINRIDYRGYAEIGEGANGFVDNLIYFSGGTPAMRTIGRIEEGHKDIFSLWNNANTNGTRCGSAATLNVGTALSLSRNKPGIPEKYSQINFDSTDAQGDAKIGITWKKC